jgi:predicted nucleotidyltransferase
MLLTIYQSLSTNTKNKSSVYHCIRMDKIIPLRVDEVMIQYIDEMVVSGLFRNRNDGIRAGIREIINTRALNRSLSRTMLAQVVANYLITARNNEIQAVILFGSVVKNNDTRESDIDILVLTNNNLSYDEEYEIVKDVGQLVYGIDEYVSVHVESCETFSAGVKSGYVFENDIVQEGKLLTGTFPNSD